MNETQNDLIMAAQAVSADSLSWDSPSAYESAVSTRHVESAPVEFVRGEGVVFGNLVGAHPSMHHVFDLAGRLAHADVPLVIEGETGTGKTALAEAIHLVGPRAGAGQCLVVDCSTLSSNFVEATLFGYEGSDSAGPVRPGLFEQANGGTLIFDQIDELSLDVQAKISRVFDAGSVRRLGGVYEVPVDVRIIATSRADLGARMHAGRFREELYYRLAITRIELPPLRERAIDVHVLLARLADQARIPHGRELAALAERLAGQRWPGNVRELKNAFDRWLALGSEALTVAGGSREPLLTAGQSRDHACASAPDDVMQRILELDLSLPRARQRVVAEFERRYVERVMRMHDGSIARAAEASGIARRYFRLLRARIRERGASA